jgi:hypothetical protein
MEDLARALGRQHHMPAALEAHYSKIDHTLTAKLTPDLAAAWQAVPLGRTGPDSSLVAIATTRPFAAEVRLELQEIFQAQIVEAIAPEMRLYYWLEQVYKIARLNRFKRIARRDSLPPVPVTESEGAPEPEESADIDLAALKNIEDAEIQKRVYVRTLSDAEPEAPAGGQLARIAVKRIAVPVSGEFDLPFDITDWKSCIRAIRQSKGRDSIAKAVTRVLQEGFDGQLVAGMLLMAKDDTALGWRGFVRDNNDVDVDALAIGLDAASIFAAPYATQEPFFGKPEEASVSDKRLWHFLGDEPEELAVLPIVVLGEVACLLYVQSDDFIPPDTVGALGDVSRAISAALTRLIRAANR